MRQSKGRLGALLLSYSTALLIQQRATYNNFVFLPSVNGLSIPGVIRSHTSISPQVSLSVSPDSSPSAAETMTSNSSNAGVNPLSERGLPSPLLLGSASFTRKLILKEMGVPFVKLVRPIDEKALGDRSQDPPHDLVLTLAKAKMDHLVSCLEKGDCDSDLPQQSSSSSSTNEKREWILLTGDQVVTCKDVILEKPESIEEARSFVSQYPHNPPSTVGSCVLYHYPSGIQVSGVDTATVHFRATLPSETLVDTLVEQNEPVLSCAGGLMVEHPLVQEHIDRIDGTQDSVMGLSKDLVLQLLDELARKLKDQKDTAFKPNLA
jgi:septum formation protein